MREAAPTLASLPFRTEHELRYSDTDAQGHINNGVSATLMETCRVTLLRGGGLKTRFNNSFVLARNEIDFLAEMFWPGNVTAAIGVERIGSTSISFRQAVFRDGVCVSAGRAVVVAFDGKTRRPTMLAEAARLELEAWRVRGG